MVISTVSSLSPFCDLIEKNSNNLWEIIGNHPCFKVNFLHSQPIFGFVLLRANVNKDNNNGSAKCFGNFSGEEFDFSLPISLKGNINQIFFLDEPVLNCYFQLENFCGVLAVHSFSMVAMSYVECRYRMWRRVIPALLNQPKSMRKHTKLTSYLAVTNITKSYDLASDIRANTGELQYDQWVCQFDTLSQSDKKKISRRANKLCKNKPVLIVIAGDNGSINRDWNRTINSISNQLYNSFYLVALSERCLDDCSGKLLIDKIIVVNGVSKVSLLEVGLFEESYCGVVVVAAGVVLAEHSVFWYLNKHTENDSLKIIYSDHDSIEDSGDRINPVFKPDWSRELCFSGNYIGDAYFIDNYLFFRLWDDCSFDNVRVSFLYELLLRATSVADPRSIGHIPSVLFHVSNEHRCGGVVGEEEKLLLIEHLAREGIDADVVEKGSRRFRIDYHIQEPYPLVTIIIPTKDALNYLAPCVTSLLKKTRYQNFEVLIIDNQSSDGRALDFFDEISQLDNVSVIEFNQPFNYSSINNFAVNQAKGEIICLLNNDTEIITEDWLDNMVGHLLQKDVGAVGAKLYFADGRVQHAGDSFGPGGCAGHFHSLIAGDDPGYCNRADLSQDLSAVTAACLLTWTSLYIDLGGLDEKNLPVAFNDVDYCLRVRECGKRVVFTPDAKLYHYESVSRGKDETPEKAKRAKMERDYMRKRWHSLLGHDPFYNPNLSYVSPNFSLSYTPMVKKPW